MSVSAQQQGENTQSCDQNLTDNKKDLVLNRKNTVGNEKDHTAENVSPTAVEAKATVSTRANAPISTSALGADSSTTPSVEEVKQFLIERRKIDAQREAEYEATNKKIEEFQKRQAAKKVHAARNKAARKQAETQPLLTAEDIDQLEALYSIKAKTETTGGALPGQSSRKAIPHDAAMASFEEGNIKKKSLGEAKKKPSNDLIDLS